MNKETTHTWKLGMFVIIGLLVFVMTIYFVGKQKNLFGSTIRIKTEFSSVNGLEVGNNVQFSGINIGTVDQINLVTDTTVVVDIIIKEEAQKFIKKDALASIGSEGLMGDKVLAISPGTVSKQYVQDNDIIKSVKPIQMDDLMRSVKKSVDNAGIITSELAIFSNQMNSGNGALSKLVSDEEFANSLKSTLLNLESSSNEFATFTKKMNNGKGALSKLVSDESLGLKIDSTITNIQKGTSEINETVKAAQNNFLLKGYFNKKKRAEAKKKAEAKKLLEKNKKNNSKK